MATMQIDVELRCSKCGKELDLNWNVEAGKYRIQPCICILTSTNKEA
jgi:hypothetical protein